MSLSNRSDMSRRKRWLLLALVLACSVPVLAQAAARAWLQPDRITLGEAVTLNVQADDAGQPPDFSVLARDFAMQGQSNNIQTAVVNGRAVRQALFGVVLVPRTAGVFTIPSLRVGNDTTAPITLTVAAAVPGSAARGDTMYMETTLATDQPYVQQAVRFTVRLYYAISLMDGGVEVATPEGATLQKIGEDLSFQREVNGRRYNVFERNFLLTPEKSGPLEIAAPRFRGRARSSNFDSFFDGGQVVSSVGEPRTLTVRPQPADAPQPWLPAEQVTLKRNDSSTLARAGEPLTLELQLDAEGATAAQLPEFNLPRIEGAQVFPEPPSKTEALTGASPKASLTRRFAIVPSRAGTLKIPELRVGYWNVGEDRADAAVLPPLQFEVEAATVASAAAPESESTQAPANAGLPGAVAVDAAALRAWQVATLVLALALGSALLWGWSRGRPPRPVPDRARAAAGVRESPRFLQRALAAGELPAIARALRGLTHPQSATLGALQARLSDRAQREAVQALERTLWSHDAGAANHPELLARLRAAFSAGVRLVHDAPAEAAQALPPLYPQRDRRAG